MTSPRPCRYCKAPVLFLSSMCQLHTTQHKQSQGRRRARILRDRAKALQDEPSNPFRFRTPKFRQDQS